MSQSTWSGEAGGSPNGPPFFSGQLETVMLACSKLSMASRKSKNREFRVQEIRRLLMRHRCAVYVLEQALAEEVEYGRKDDGGDFMLRVRQQHGGGDGTLTPDTVTGVESQFSSLVVD